jgi:transcriptional regulator with XRE-family HTH domain
MNSEVIKVNIHEMRTALGETQSQFAERYGIPFRTIQNWETGQRKPPDYVMNLLEERVQSDLINRKTIVVPEYDPQKKDLPSYDDYVTSISWLEDIQRCLGKNFVFALDEALMCQCMYEGHTGEYIVWGYGDSIASQYNGVVLLGNTINLCDVRERLSLRYTSFNRTVIDALANENILDMQGITEALSQYYYTHKESFSGLFIPPMYQNDFSELAKDAIDYYTY